MSPSDADGAVTPNPEAPIAADPDLAATRQAYETMATYALADLEQRRQSLLATITQLEDKRDRLRADIKQSFAGSSQEITTRLQGFKDYLVGSLQDLVAIAEETELSAPSAPGFQPIQLAPDLPEPTPPEPAQPQFREPVYQSNARRVRELLALYETTPDYYGPPWQMRRALDPTHGAQAQQWFLEQGARGTLKSAGRKPNILIGAAAISVLCSLYGDRLRVLVSANTPERLGSWRRGLQDCLGLNNSDFGPNGGVMLFEDPEPMALKADRLTGEGDLPMIIIDDADGLVSLALLQHPIWLAFAPEYQVYSANYRY